MADIQLKEIRGINVKNLLAIIIATGSTVTTVLISYANLSAQIVKTQTSIERTQARMDSEGKYNDLRLDVMDKTVTLLQLQIDNLKKDK